MCFHHRYLELIACLFLKKPASETKERMAIESNKNTLDNSGEHTVKP